MAWYSWSRGWESNPRPADYESAALATELPRPYLTCLKKASKIDQTSAVCQCFALVIPAELDRGLVGRSPAEWITRKSLVTRWEIGGTDPRWWDRLSRIDGQDARPTEEQIASSLDSSAMTDRRQALSHSRLNGCANFNIMRLRMRFCNPRARGPGACRRVIACAAIWLCNNHTQIETVPGRSPKGWVIREILVTKRT